MSSARDTIAVARDMMARYGNDAIDVVDRRLQDNLSAGDAEAAAFWSQVVQALRALLND